MYERLSQKPISRSAFLVRLLKHVGFASAIVGVSLAVGMLGYTWLEGLGWWDAFLQASMLLAGMGLVITPHAPVTKLFAGLYALYSGLVFVTVTTIVLAPVLHRLLHTFHWREDGGG